MKVISALWSITGTSKKADRQTNKYTGWPKKVIHYRQSSLNRIIILVRYRNRKHGIHDRRSRRI